MDNFGGLGGLGGFDVGNLFAALGSSLLTSPRYAPLSGLPAGIQMANKTSEDAQSRAAMMVVAQKLGLDPRLAANPQAMSLLINSENQKQNMNLAQDAIKGIDGLFGGGGGGSPAASPAPQRPGSLGGLGGVPSFADASGPMGAYLGRLVQRESGGNPTAQAATSSAFGPVQFTRGTWNDTVKAHPELGLTAADFSDPSKHGPAAVAFTKDNAAALAAAGQNPNDPASLYAAHFLGRGGGVRFLNGLRVNPDAPAASYVERDQVAANRPVFFNKDGSPKTAGQVYASFQNSFGGSAAPAPSSGGVQVAQADTGTATDAPAPYKVAAAGGAIPAPLRNVPDVPPAHPNTAGDGTTTQKTLAQQQAKWGMKMMLVGGVTKNEGLVAAGKEAFALGSDYLKTPEMIKLMQAAGMSQEQQAAAIRMSLDKRPDPIKIAEAAYAGDPVRAQEALRNSIQDNRPDPVKLGQAAQDTPGLVKSGQEALAAQKGAETAATTRATALTEEAGTATTAGRSATQLLGTLKEARSYFKEVAEAGGTGPMTANPIRRAVVASVSPESTAAYKNEVLRAKFDNAIASIKNEKARMTLSGQGPVSNFERTIAAADVPDLRVVSPQVGFAAFDRLEKQLQAAIALDKEQGLHQGRQPGAPATSGKTSSGHTWSIEP